MINTYSSYQKTQWQGAQNILLADNFGIEWLRKGSLDFSRVQDIVNPQTGESITKSRDCQEVPKVMIQLFYKNMHNLSNINSFLFRILVEVFVYNSIKLKLLKISLRLKRSKRQCRKPRSRCSRNSSRSTALRTSQCRR